jgi:carbonic anhydrase
MWTDLARAVARAHHVESARFNTSYRHDALGFAAAMASIEKLLEQNRAWSEARRAEDPDFFEKLVGIQRPGFLWIGCSDSRVPANQIVAEQPGEIFVHRNVGNVVAAGDPNCLSVIQFAVDVLGVAHVIVCGHYGCGAVQAALGDPMPDPIGGWLAHIARIREDHAAELDTLEGEARARRLCELNVLGQREQVCSSPAVGDAWRRGRELAVHAWIYDLHDGLLKTLAGPRSG